MHRPPLATRNHNQYVDPYDAAASQAAFRKAFLARKRRARRIRRVVEGIVAVLVLLAVLWMYVQQAYSPQNLPVGDAKLVEQAKQDIAIVAVSDLLVAGYDRDMFGSGWIDVDRNGCDTRNDILARDLTNVVYKPGSNCVVIGGTLNDPYTGQVIEFSKDNASAVQIDHVVALSDAYSTGANTWSEDERIRFSNDPLNLVASDGPANMGKGDKNAAEWLPVADFQCEFVARQTVVKAEYGLWMSTAEHATISRVLDACTI